MRHRKLKKIDLTPSHRDAMFRNMVTSLFKYGRIKTTLKKGKALRKWADKLVALAKRGDLHSLRQALAIMREKQVLYKLFEEVNDKFSKNPGSCVKLYKVGLRAGDAAKMVVVELVSYASDEAVEKKSTKNQEKAKEKTPTVTAVKEEAKEENKVEEKEETKEKETKDESEDAEETEKEEENTVEPEVAEAKKEDTEEEKKEA